MGSIKVVSLLLVVSLIYICEVTSCPDSNREFINKHVCVGDATNVQGCAKTSSARRHIGDKSKGGKITRNGVDYVQLTMFTIAPTTSIGQASHYTTKKQDRTERNAVVNKCTAEESNHKCCLLKQTLPKYDCEIEQSKIANGNEADWTCTFQANVHPLHGDVSGHYYGDV